MARFTAGVRLGKNDLGFDPNEATTTQTAPNRAVIEEWLA